MLTLSTGSPGFPPGLGNRRCSNRFEPVRREARLRWHGDSALDLGSAGHFALLLDIGMGGASIAIDRLPAGSSEAVWLRLEAEAAPEWSEAVIVEVTPTAEGPYLVRLAFRSPCPIDTIRTAVLG